MKILRMLFILMIFFFVVGCNNKYSEVSKPNIVFILADDMGYGDVSALNPKSRIQTPAIDALVH